MKCSEFVSKLIDIAKNYKTLYVMGCIGYRMTEANKKRAINNGAHGSYNAKSSRQKMIKAATEDTWGFDCVCLIKSVLWGWKGDYNATYGGAKYASNGVPDINADQMINVCKGVSTDFSKIEIGEAVWLKGHIGVYIGDGLAVECTPAWDNCVQITSCNCDKKGYNRRNWTKHGKLPYITYEKAEIVPENKENEVKTMRYYKLNEEMNIRITPNGVKVGAAPMGAVINGSEIETHNGVQWLKTSYNGINGYIAVSGNYATEVEAPKVENEAESLKKAINEAIKILSEAVK
jgi:hypothetical protein